MAELVFDFGEAEAGVEDAPPRRSAALRDTPLLRPAKLVAGSREYLCVVRSLSEVGLGLRLFHALPAGLPLAIEFDCGTRLAVEPIWSCGDQLACAFAGPVDIAPLLSSRPTTPPRRQPRIRVAHAAALYAERVKAEVMVRDISQRGAAIDTRTWLAVDELVRLESPVLPITHARVRWRRPPRYGLEFEATFGLAELARLCSLL